jgi:hypothetical protein
MNTHWGHQLIELSASVSGGLGMQSLWGAGSNKKKKTKRNNNKRVYEIISK